MSKLAYNLSEPEVTTSCVVFASPHSGRDYAWSFLRTTVLDDQLIRSSEDAFVDRLFDCAPQFGAPLLRANAPRAYVDLNRGVDELDPALIEGIRRGGHNPRVASGLGVIPRVVSGGRAIYRGKLPKSEADQRIERIWRPYHARLNSLLRAAHEAFGESILVDCHSMPREALDSSVRSGASRPEIVIGDRFGASASGEIVERIEMAFAQVGLKVARNAPFAGAYSTQYYGRPSQRQHAVQIEIDRSVYMCERTVRPNQNFHAFRKLLRSVVAEISAIGHREQRLAAE